MHLFIQYWKSWAVKYKPALKYVRCKISPSSKQNDKNKIFTQRNSDENLKIKGEVVMAFYYTVYHH